MWSRIGRKEGIHIICLMQTFKYRESRLIEEGEKDAEFELKRVKKGVKADSI
ncbi:MAG: hypothetical protein P0116_15545 [Candidatus Nitrosocosmicus sp.]|nr:hypothetical protein [Candidatus Nitrosocosmicus sp.]